MHKQSSATWSVPLALACLAAPSAGQGHVLLSEGFEAGAPGWAGWGAGPHNLWRVAPDGDCGAVTTMAAYNDPTNCTYNTGEAQVGQLITPPVLLLGQTPFYVVLDYRRKMDADPDQACVRLRIVGTTGGTPVSCSLLNDGLLHTAQLVVPASFTGEEVQFIFEVFANHIGNADLGWQIDNVRVLSSGPVAGGPFCFGDGSGAPCGCGNSGNVGGGCANGPPMPAGQGAVLGYSGTSSVTRNDLVLTVDFATNQPGLFFQGNNAVGGGSGATFGDGIRCCGGNVIRLEIADPSGSAGPHTTSTTRSVLTTSPPSTTGAGDTRCYQYWYRNSNESLCGTGFNLSNAVSITWTM